MIVNEKALKIIEAAKSQLGNPYVFGMWGRECTPSVRRQYAGYNPSHKRAIFKACPVLSGKQPNCDGCKWQGKLAFDCRGFTYWCLLQVGITIKGGGATSQYNTAANWVRRGDIGDMPDVVCCVFQRRNGRMQHTGLHIGGGKVIHCSNGVQWGDTSDKAWTHYAIPAGLYAAEEIAAAGKPDTSKPTESVVFNLRRGSKGADVTKLQTALNALGYDCGAADGIFGAATEKAVRAFQKDNSLAVDGIAGKATQEALYAAESVPRATYTVTLRNVPQADAIALTAKYAGEMIQEG
nr:MAG TPA: N acetylmuramidase [Caudoviricetes sp.]